MRLIDETHVGAPGRAAEEERQEMEIQKMRAEVGDIRDY
jgi:hypothetical protein